MIAPSQGVHIVLRQALPRRRHGDHGAAHARRARDVRHPVARPHGGRHDRHARSPRSTLEPRPLAEEIDFILETASGYLSRQPDAAPTSSACSPASARWSRPATPATPRRCRASTRSRSARSGLLTIAGGKWTTYRKMAEDCVDHAATLAGLDERPCVTRDLRIHGYHPTAPRSSAAFADYGADAPALRRPGRGAARARRRARRGAAGPRRRRCSGPCATRWRARVDDVLARRTRVAARSTPGPPSRMAPAVARLMAAELGRDEAWQREQLAAFAAIAEGYLPG